MVQLKNGWDKEQGFMSPSKITKALSAKEFLRLAQNNRSSIKSSKVIPPKLGSSGFGKIIVELTHGSK